MRFTLDGSASTDFLREESRDAILSDTGELGWYNASQKRGVVTVDTVFTAALIGYVKSNGRQTTHLAADVANDFCMLLLSSLDARPLDQVVPHAAGHDCPMREHGPQLAGGPPDAGAGGHGTDAIAQPPCGTVRLLGLGRVAAIDVTPLSPTGNALPVSQRWITRERPGH